MGGIHHPLRTLIIIIAALAAPLALSAPAPQAPLSAKVAVDLELVLATDNSQSIDRSEALLQRHVTKSLEAVRRLAAGKAM